MVRAGKLKPLANMSDKPLNISGYGEVPPITMFYPNFPSIGSHFGIMIAKGTPADVIAAVSKAFDVAAKSEALAKFAEQKAVFLVNLKGAEADKKMEDVASIVTWTLFEGGAAKISPAQFNIPKPKQ
jgi:tripartite-type tricarboxylate transporter receptor subunit TctC